MVAAADQAQTMAKKFPIHPAHPERTCWGCDQYCAHDAMACGNGSDRTPHPSEMFGDDWALWEPAPVAPTSLAAAAASAETAGAERPARD